MLTIYEELFLLSLDEERGSIFPHVKRNLGFGLAGGILAELALQGKIKANNKHRLELTNTDSTGIALIDETIQALQTSEKPRRPAFWVGQFNQQPRKMRERIGDDLAIRGFLHQEDKQFYRPSISGDGQPAVPARFEMKEQLRGMIFANKDANTHNLALLAIAKASGLFSLIFTLDELNVAAREIQEKVVRVALVDPSMLTIEEIEQAVTLSLEDAD